MQELYPKILVVDDHELVALGIRQQLINSFPNAEIDLFTEGILSDIAQQKNLYDLYIIDLELRDISGIELIDRIKQRNPEAIILVYTFHEGIWFIKQLKVLKVNGVLTKSSGKGLLSKAVSELLKGNTYFCEQFHYLNNASNGSNSNPILNEMLTENESDILKLTGRGYTIKEIATMKAWSVKTVEHYRRRLFDKFGVSNSSRLIAIAFKEGFLKKEDL